MRLRSSGSFVTAMTVEDALLCFNNRGGGREIDMYMCPSL